MPTFYSPVLTDDEEFFSGRAVCVVAVLFGGIHCIAWSFYFPSLREQLAWRISAASMAGLPAFMFAYAYFVNTFEERFPRLRSLNIVQNSILTVGVASAVLYIIARIALLVLPCIALRALPPTAFDEIPWASFLPHIH
jgi:DNA helicase HerA-like ATPase